MTERPLSTIEMQVGLAVVEAPDPIRTAMGIVGAALGPIGQARGDEIAAALLYQLADHLVTRDRARTGAPGE